jgi:hypothetical protein
MEAGRGTLPGAWSITDSALPNGRRRTFVGRERNQRVAYRQLFRAAGCVPPRQLNRWPAPR